MEQTSKLTTELLVKDLPAMYACPFFFKEDYVCTGAVISTFRTLQCTHLSYPKNPYKIDNGLVVSQLQ